MCVMPHAHRIIPQHPCPCPSQGVTYPTGVVVRMISMLWGCAGDDRP